MPQHSIYALCEPGTNRMRYVGQTSRQIEARLKQHVSIARSQKFSAPVNDWIRSLDDSPGIIILERCPASDALDVERAWIASCVKRGYQLLNVQDCELHETKHSPSDWDKRKNITLPADMADVIIEEAKRQHVPVYRLVYDAVVTLMVPTTNGDAETQP